MKLICATVLAVLLYIGLACKKDIESSPVDPPENPSTSFLPNKSVKIEIPAGTGLDLANAKLVSLAGETSIAGDGTGKIYQKPGSIVMAYVFDKDKNPILAGFVNDSLTTIDASATAKVLLYWAHGIHFTNSTKLTQNYITSAGNAPGVKEWIKDFEELFKTDPLTLSNKSYVPALKTIMEKMKATNTIDIKGKPSDIVVDGGDKRSGLQVFDDGLSHLSINNYYRRRAHAFLYKMKWKDDNGKVTILHTDIKETTKSDKEFAVDPVAAINSVTGEIGKWIEDKDAQSAVVKNGPTLLELGEQESEAEYALRIVGPGTNSAFLTNEEESRFLKLYLETFTFDVVLPVLAASLSVGDMMSTPKSIDPTLKQSIMKLIEDQWKAVPEVYEAVKKGEYKNALSKLLENLYKDASKAALREISFTAIQIYTLDKEVDLAGVGGKLDKMLKILTVMDAAMTAGDVGRIRLHQGFSNWSDQWKVLARSSQVRLLPSESAVLQNERKTISAVIKNLQLPKDVHAFYEWSSSGKFGVLEDTKGHSGTSFASADSLVKYDPTSNEADLSDGDNLEYIYVTAKLADKIIGRDTAVLNVRKNQDKYVINPTGITLSGKENQYSRTRLYLEPADGNTKWNIPNGIFEYKIVWTTSGKHGKLLNFNESANTFTAENYGDMMYECRDKDTKEGKETVTARIYTRLKGISTIKDDYKFHSEVSVTININNDDKKRILHIPIKRIHRDKKEGPFTDPYSGATFFSYYHWQGNVVEVPQDPNAKSYSLRYVWTNIKVIPQPTGESWAADKTPYNTPPTWVRSALENGNYTVVHSWGSSQGGTPPTDGHADGGGGQTGIAEVIITLK